MSNTVKKAPKKVVVSNKAPKNTGSKKAVATCLYEQNLRASEEELEAALIPGKVKIAKKKYELEITNMEADLDQQSFDLTKSRQSLEGTLAERAGARIKYDVTKRKLALAGEEFNILFS